MSVISGTSELRQQSVIVFLTLEGCALTEIHRHMKAICGNGFMNVRNTGGSYVPKAVVKMR